jgi:hypothetical protein
MPVISGGVVVQPGRILFEEVTFTEAGAAGTYTGSVTVPANSWLLDIKIYNLTYWGAGTSADMDVGDVADPNGWFAAVSVKATDIVDYTTGTHAEVIDFNNAGGKPGVYLVAATGERELMYATTARVITGLITTVGTTSTAGRTRMIVIYTDPTVATAATYAAT